MPTKQNFKQFVRGAPPTPAYKKRVDTKSESSPRKTKTTQIGRVKSPVKGEPTPEYAVFFHARERHGKMFMSHTMSVSPKKFAEILTIWVLKAHAELGYHPVVLLKAMLVAGIDAWKDVSGEDFSALSQLLKSVKIEETTPPTDEHEV